ncbi:MAG: hypothetical protein XD95_0688 [Microgenomates bacterium 39_7]|nr:MAG: hypothetical protein XD95_0688 [Microgenomates bacterium 39_7]
MKKINLQSSAIETNQENLTSTDQNITSSTTETPVDENTQIVHNQDSVSQLQTENDPEMKKKQKKMLIIMCVVAVVAGIGTGFGAHLLRAQQTRIEGGPEPAQMIAEGEFEVGDVFGIQDTDIFKDTAQGYLERGGINGEGSHRLLRPGGESQTVYLTSTVTDLDKLVGAEVKVWGETYKGQKAGWLMDVGKVEIIKVNGEAPFEEEL